MTLGGESIGSASKLVFTHVGLLLVTDTGQGTYCSMSSTWFESPVLSFPSTFVLSYKLSLQLEPSVLENSSSRSMTASSSFKVFRAARQRNCLLQTHPRCRHGSVYMPLYTPQ